MPRSSQFNAVRRNLSAIRDFVEQAAAVLGADLDSIYDMAGAVDEAATNVIIHGYHDQGGPLEIELTRDGDSLVVHMRDSAAAFDPTTVAAPDTTLSLDERPLGGMGIHLIRQYTDAISYRALPGGGNEVTLTRSMGKRHKD
jgi:serine/threonine-protein kinase RsbW